LRRRHRLAERLLTDLLGMPPARVHDVACRFEHIIDDEVEGYLLAALNHPTTCPHGNPLGGQAAISSGWQTLDTLQPGETGVLRCITNETAPMLDYLGTLKMHPGTQVQVQERAPFELVGRHFVPPVRARRNRAVATLLNSEVIVPFVCARSSLMSQVSYVRIISPIA
jgi:hypothetical protein